jgi:predicted nucleic acid-binding protein
LLAGYSRYGKNVSILDPHPTTPACREPFDVPFVQPAPAGKAKALITGDQDSPGLAGGFACPMVTAEQFIDTLTP